MNRVLLICLVFLHSAALMSASAQLVQVTCRGTQSADYQVRFGELVSKENSTGNQIGFHVSFRPYDMRPVSIQNPKCSQKVVRIFSSRDFNAYEIKLAPYTEDMACLAGSTVRFYDSQEAFREGWVKQYVQPPMNDGSSPNRVTVTDASCLIFQ